MSTIPGLPEAGLEDGCELQITMDYIISSRLSLGNQVRSSLQNPNQCTQRVVKRATGRTANESVPQLEPKGKSGDM